MTESICLKLDELQAFKSAGDGQREFLSRVRDAAPTRELAIQKSIANRVLAFPADLQRDLDNGGSAIGIEPLPGRTWSVVLAHAGGRPRRLSYPDGSIVALDYDYVVKAFLFCYFAVSDKRHCPTVATSLLGLVSGIPNGPIPFQDVLWACAWHSDQSLAHSVMSDIVDFIVLHEAGHIYLDAHGADFLQMVVVDPARAVGGVEAVFGPGSVVTEFSVGTQGRSLWQQVTRPGHEPSLILPGTDVSERREYGPDVFALLTRFVLDSQGIPDGRLALQVTPARMLFWNLLFVFEAVVEESMNVGIANQYMLEMSRREAGRERSHPHAHSRVSVLHFHISELLRRLAVADANATMAVCSGVHDSLWSDRFWTGVALASNACEKRADNTMFEQWVPVFDSMDARMGSVHTELRPNLKCLVVKSYGELCGLVAAVTLGTVPPDRFSAFELAIGERIIQGLAGDTHFGEHLAPLTRAITDLPKTGG
ncbi:MAG: hypothetical protein NXI27_07795 [Alphaproteobacteria bacterium]|nr:hypothetical protein [Alphaproteobacteria bacterium]